jgi:hypothetical protein
VENSIGSCESREQETHQELNSQLLQEKLAPNSTGASFFLLSYHFCQAVISAEPFGASTIGIAQQLKWKKQ